MTLHHNTLAKSMLQQVLTPMLLLLLVISSATMADQRVVCPSDPSIFGYNSIASMNQDIATEVEAINSSPLISAQSIYTFTFCPNTVFDGTHRLTPMLNNSVFTCGQNGKANDNCIILGGSEAQIYLIETEFSSIEYLSFWGLTLHSSTNFGVAAFGSNASTAEFYDCHWQNNSGTDSSSQGGSSIHVVFQEYVPPSLTREETVENNIFDREASWQRRSLQDTTIHGMNVHLYNCSITDGFQTDESTYRAIFSEGFIWMDNVTIAYNDGGLLTNIVGGTAVMENSLFLGNDMTASIRVTDGGTLLLRNTNFLQNEGTANVVVVESEATIQSCGFLDNFLATAEIFASSNFRTNTSIGSIVTVSDSCIVRSNLSTLVFSDEFSNTTGSNNYAEGLRVSSFCVGSPYGIFKESSGFSCYQDAAGLGDCSGVCEPLDAETCVLGTLTRAPTSAPTRSPTLEPTDLTPTFSPTMVQSNEISTENPSNVPSFSRPKPQQISTPNSAAYGDSRSTAIRTIISWLSIWTLLAICHS